MSLRARLLAAMAYMLVLAIVAFGVPLAVSLRTRVNEEVLTQARSQADLIAATAGDLLSAASRPELRSLVKTASASLRGRVLIVDARGIVLVDSAVPGEVGTNYRSRPELGQALAGRADQVQRDSHTLGQAILATAVPIIHNGAVAGAVRVTQSVGAVSSAVSRVELALGAVGLTVLAIGLVFGSVLAAQIGRPLRRLEAVAHRVAQGDLSARATIEGSSEQRSLSRSFNEMTSRMALLLGAQRRFVADASHQLRTPLTGLRLRLEAARELAHDAAVEAELDEGLSEVDRLSATVAELLALSQAGERQLAGTSIDLGELVAAARTRWRAEAGQRGIGLECDSRPRAGTVFAARADADRALDALIENALRYSPRGSSVSLAALDGRLVVSDRGAGIEADEREAVFERFHRGSAGRSGASGHGLGLPIARELARAWGGEVQLEPRPGGGTVATLTLPPATPAGEPRAADFARA